MGQRFGRRSPHCGVVVTSPSVYVGRELHWIDGSCMTRRTWEQAWRCLVTEMTRDPLAKSTLDAQHVANELARGPWGETMALAVA